MGLGADRLLTATRILLEGTSLARGDAFFRGLARGIAEVLGVKYSLVGALLPGRDAIRAIGFWCDGRFVDDFEYDLEGTPCSDVMASGTCYFPSRIQAQYPADKLLNDMGIESYIGIPVRAPGGPSVGILVALHDAPTDHAMAELHAIFELYAGRAALELERIRAEERLAGSEARYRQIVSNCHDGVWTLDGAGVTTYANAQMATMLGHTPEAMLGRHLFDFMDADARVIAAGNLERRRQGVSEQHSFRLQHRDGSDVWTLMSTSPLLDDQARHVGALALVSNVTERRALERRMQHAQKLESLGVLAGGIAHDFNNLLVGILGNAGFARAKLPAGSPLAPVLDDIQRGAQRAAELTRHMLAYAGRGHFAVEAVDLNAVVQELSQLLATVISKRAVLRFELAPGLPVVEGDATGLRQIVMNLITNASDALDDQDGEITVTTGVVDADRAYLRGTYLDEQLAEGRYVSLEVADTGVGMDAATQERIFDPFFTTKFTGRGLGMAAVLGILRGHRGAVKVDSARGKGTRLTILVPVSERTQPAAAAAPPVVAAPRGEGVVLVADDERLVAEAVARVLEDVGFEVLIAGDGRQAVELVAADPDRIVAVLLDLTMPRLSGAEAFRQIRALRPRLPIVITSGHDEHEATTQFAGQNLSGFLRKPWTFDELLDGLRAAISAGREPSNG